MKNKQHTAGATRLKYSTNICPKNKIKFKKHKKNKRKTHNTSTQNNYAKLRKSLKSTHLIVCLKAVSEV